MTVATHQDRHVGNAVGELSPFSVTIGCAGCSEEKRGSPKLYQVSVPCSWPAIGYLCVCRIADELFLPHGASVYVGFDPTADSLHVGNLMTIMVLLRLQRMGYQPIALVNACSVSLWTMYCMKNVHKIVLVCNLWNIRRSRRGIESVHFASLT